MKNLLIALVILSSLVSCGKKNTVGGTASAPANVVNGLTVTGTVETQLSGIIDTNEFGLGKINYYTTWKQHVAQAPNTTYSYGSMAPLAAANTNTGCDSFFDCILPTFTFTWSSSFSTSNVTVTRTVVHSSVNLVTKQNELKAILNKRNYIQEFLPGVYRIMTTDNIVYIFDRNYPIEANPVQNQTTTSGDTIVNIQ